MPTLSIQYNKANLLADAKKGKGKRQLGKWYQEENSETKKSDSNQYGLWIVIALVVVMVALLPSNNLLNKKED